MEKNDFFKNKDNVIAIVGIIFFVVLGIFARFNTTSNNNSNENNNNNNNQEIIENENKDSEKEQEEIVSYNFTYTVDNNNQISIIEGKIYNNKQKFSIIENGVKQEYAKLGDNYLKLGENEYEILKGDINEYFKYLELDDIIEFTDYSIFEENDDTKTYEIDVPDLIDKYNFELEYDSFSDFKSDSITIVEDNGNVEKITLDYSNYFSYITNSNYKFKVTMNFNGYGKVEDFEI